MGVIFIASFLDCLLYVGRDAISSSGTVLLLILASFPWLELSIMLLANRGKSSCARLVLRGRHLVFHH